MKPTYTNLILDAGELIAAPAGYTGRHELVRVEHPWLAQPIIVAAYALPAKQHAEAMAAAEQHTIYGKAMLVPTVEEAFIICDRSQYPALPKAHFPDIDEAWWTWTSTPYAAPSGASWVVYLYNGYASWDYHVGRSHVRAVLAGYVFADATLAEEARTRSKA